MAFISLIPPVYYNVAQYGVAPGNSAATNDTAIASARSAAVSAGGGIVFFPPGNFNISATISVPNNITFQGSGDGASVIAMQTINTDVFAGVDVTNVSFRDLKIVGTGSGSGKGVNFTLSSHGATTYITMSNVTIQSVGGDGIAITNPIVSSFQRVVSQSNGGYGFNLSGQIFPGGAGTSVTLDACYANANTTAGYRLYNMVYTSLNGCAADGNPIAYLIDTCQSVALTGCGGEGNTTNTFKVTGGYGITLTSPWVYNNYADAIYITGSAHCVTVIGAIDNLPHAGATSFIKTDAGTNVALLSCNNTTANNLATGTTATVVDNGGSAIFPGTFRVSNGAAITFGVAGDTDLYRLGSNSLATDGLFTAFGGLNSQGGSTLYSGSGAPSNTNGVNGDYYFRTDTPGTTNQRIYVKSAGSWVGIL
jgi:hypothetical protein